ncbi:MAG TPA: PAS domain S-box protein [Candidatus Udaeobacter sp.]|nr:PAS domain S-box protein [Candidatus Udaeobacter sp.]
MPVKRHAAQSKKWRRKRDKIAASDHLTMRELIRVNGKSKHATSRLPRKLSTNGEVGKAKRLPSKSIYRHPKTELEAAVQRYVDLFEFAPIGYVSFDRVGRIHEINLAAANLLDSAPGSLIGHPFALHVTKDDVGVFLNHLSRCRRSYGRVESELHLKNKNGEVALTRLTTSPITSSTSNGPLLYQTAIVDLTERQRFEERIQRSEERYRTLFDLVPVAVYVCDAGGIIREYNRRAVELWGSEPGNNGQEPRFCGSHKIYYPDGRPMPHEECPMARVLRGEQLSTEDLEIIVERPGGERRNVISVPRILKSANGKATGAINSLFDITDRKHAEADAMRLAAVVQSSHDAIVAKTLDGIITDWNQSAERIFGYNTKEIIGKSIQTLIPKERHPEEQQIIRTIRQGRSLDHFETVRLRKDGKQIDVSLTISPITNPKGEIIGISKIARDITTQKQTERRLTEQARLLDLTNDAIIVRDPQDRITYWNRGAAQMYGFSAKEALGKRTHELLRTAHFGSYESIQKNLELDNHWSGELLHTRKDGEKIVVLSRWSLDRNAHGQPLSILETNTDITARKWAEKRQRVLYQFAQRQHTATKLGEIHDAALEATISALDCQRAAILLLDKENVMRFVAWRGLSQKYRKAVEGHSPWRRNAKNPAPLRINNVDTADIPSPLKSTIRREGIRAAAFIPLISSHKLIGKLTIYYRTPHVFSDDELKVASTIASQLAQAIEHKRDEEALREKESELELMVTQTPFMLTRCTRDLRYRYVSRSYAELVRRKPEELAGAQIDKIIGKEALTKIMPYVEKVLQGNPVEYEMEIPFQGVGALWMQCVYTPDRDADGKVVGWFASLAEVGRHKEAEAVLKKSKELLEKSVRERTSDLHTANKELKAEIARRKGLEGEILEVSDREQQRLAQELHDGLCQHLTAVAFMTRSVALRLKNHRVIEVKDIEKIAELVNNAASDTRNLSRALHRVDVDAGGFVKALEDLVDREMWRTPCRLEVKRSFHIENDIVAGHLYRIAREAVINANKHAEASEIVIAIRGFRNGIVLSITDNGVGAQNIGNGSHGLGFHIMNYRARVIGGTLNIEHLEKGGTRVTCYVPDVTIESHNGKKRQRARLSAKLTKALTTLL